MRTRTLFIAVLCLSLMVLSGTVLAADYVGSDKCKTCHSDQYAEWQKTKHGNMVQDASEVLGSKTKDNYKYVLFNQYIIDNNYNWASEQWNPETKAIEPGTRNGSWLQSCGSCHVTGLKDGKFVEAGVGCESCHGPGGDHIKSFSAADIRSNPGVEMCAPCHDGERQIGQMKAMSTRFEGEPAGHLGLFEDALATSDHYELRCAKCHSATVALAVKKGEEVPTLDDFRTGDLKDDRYGITCVLCHDPHQVTENPFQLREDTQTTCTQCHTSTSDFMNPLPAGEVFDHSPHHPQTEAVRGRGAVGVVSTQTHGSAQCVDCHMANGNHIFLPGTPTVTLTVHGHEETFEPCATCHDDMTAARLEGFQAKMRAQIEALSAEAEALAAEAEGNEDALALIEKANTNIGFVSVDASTGVHNPGYFQDALDAAQAFLEGAKALL